MVTPERAALVARAIPDFLLGMRHALAAGHTRTVLWYWEWISTYLWRHGRFAEYLECDRCALAAAERLAAEEPAESRRLRATICAELGFAHLELGDLAPAERYVRLAEELYREAGDAREVARALRYRATLHGYRGDYAAAAALCREALDLLDAAAGRPGEAAPDAMPLPLARSPLHNLLGTLALERGDYTMARRELIAALALTRAAGADRAYWALAPLFNLGRVAQRQGAPRRAGRYYARCLALTADGTNPSIRAYALDELARLVAETARPGDGERRATARRLAGEALALYEAMGKWRERARAAAFLARLRQARPADRLHYPPERDGAREG
ncbi:MAG TPA: tetratricopeptide repeat protein [Thermomicrobiales bacterium]|nr:tetratricopeptide repeat protein [Thermomicrobiales bacterium]